MCLWWAVDASHIESIAKRAADVRAQKRAKTDRPPPFALNKSDFIPSFPQQHHLRLEDVMAAHSAVRAINTQDITAKAERDLLQLLEAVCKGVTTTYVEESLLMLDRFVARRTWSLNVLSPALSASSSSSADYRSMASTRSSFSRTTMSMPASGTSCFSSEARTRRKSGR